MKIRIAGRSGRGAWSPVCGVSSPPCVSNHLARPRYLGKQGKTSRASFLVSCRTRVRHRTFCASPPPNWRGGIKWIRAFATWPKIANATKCLGRGKETPLTSQRRICVAMDGVLFSCCLCFIILALSAYLIEGVKGPIQGPASCFRYIIFEHGPSSQRRLSLKSHRC